MFLLHLPLPDAGCLLSRIRPNGGVWLIGTSYTCCRHCCRGKAGPLHQCLIELSFQLLFAKNELGWRREYLEMLLSILVKFCCCAWGVSDMELELSCCSFVLSLLLKINLFTILASEIHEMSFIVFKLSQSDKQKQISCTLFKGVHRSMLVRDLWFVAWLFGE